MEVVFAHCAGLDVHKKMVVACVFVANPQGEMQRHIRTYPTTLAGLEALAASLSGLRVSHVAMESTGGVLEAGFQRAGTSLRGVDRERPRSPAGGTPIDDGG